VGVSGGPKDGGGDEAGGEETYLDLCEVVSKRTSDGVREWLDTYKPKGKGAEEEKERRSEGEEETIYSCGREKVLAREVAEAVA
jgi:hypothetical protein